MQQADLTHFKSWFREYVSGFHATCEGDSRPITMKEKHTERTCEEILLLGRELGLSETDLLLAETAALFHDIGRFPQWQRYRTFIDSQSRDHALLGLEVLEEHEVVSRISPEPREIVYEAIRHHSLKEVTSDLPPQHLFFARLLRDADKLDIWHLISTRNSESSDLVRILAGNMEGGPQYSSEIVTQLKRGKMPDFSRVRNHHDILLLRLGWVFDLNFIPSCRHVLHRGYIERLCSQLPARPEVSEIQDYLISYLKDRINSTPSL